MDKDVIITEVPTEADIVRDINASATAAHSDSDAESDSDIQTVDVATIPPTHAAALEAVETLRRYMISRDMYESTSSSLIIIEKTVHSQKTLKQCKITEFMSF